MNNLSLLFIAFLFLHLTTFAQWTQLEDMPTARWGNSACMVDDKIYVFGGSQSTSYPATAIGTMEVYDPILNSWDITKAPMPTPRLMFMAAVVNGKIYAIGGRQQWIGQDYGIVEVYDPVSDTWDTKMPMPKARTVAGCCVIDDKIYVIGGIKGGPGISMSNDLQIYDPATDTWDITKASMNYNRDPKACVLNDKVYAIGGAEENPPYLGHHIVEAYEPATDTWTLKADLQEGRKGLSADVVDGKIYVIGGEDGTDYVVSVEVYDPITDSWTIIEETQIWYTMHASSVFQDKIYLFGGSVTGGGTGNFTPTSIVFSFDPSLLVNVESQNNIIPEYFVLHQAFPNPFNPTTIVRYEIAELSFVTLKVYDVLGSEVAILANGEKAVGSYGVEFDATGLPSGIYFYKLQTGNFVETKKMVLLR